MKTPDNRPKNIYVTSFGFKSLEKNEFATVFIDPSLEGDGFGTYIRKDIVLDMMEQSVVKGFEHAVKGNNLFTKEQVVKMIFDFQFDFFSSVNPEFVDETEIIKYAEEFFSKNKAI